MANTTVPVGTFSLSNVALHQTARGAYLSFDMDGTTVANRLFVPLPEGTFASAEPDPMPRPVCASCGKPFTTGQNITVRRGGVMFHLTCWVETAESRAEGLG